ncbi:MAG: glutamate-1-semialdehyde 2,1-aminomutase [Phycisphaerae bacterium]|nr:glutamate-1-semialdehyde 2,1-aminomutase [Phycisphaerae bacterium]
MSRRTDKSKIAFEQAEKVLVGGVNSPVRAYGAVGGQPPFIARASGARLMDLDGNEYIDYVGTWGPAILGHAHPKVVEAVCDAARKGASFGAPTEAETRLAEVILAALPSCEKVRFTSSGTEATMTAIRLARGATGRDKIVKFIGGYHGHADALLVQAGSGATTLGVPSSPGVPADTTSHTLPAPYNDAEATARLFAEHGEDIAAVLVEPVAGNMGVIPPADGFLRALREQCTRRGALLIFDEVMTGFRVARGGAQGLYGVRPDITTLGKIIGGGLPVGAVAGRAKIMDHLAPIGPVYQAGTLSGNPVAMAAGLATLELLAQPGIYEALETTSANLSKALQTAASEAGLSQKVCFQRVGSMLCCFFTPGPVRNYDDAKTSNLEAFNAWFHAMLDGGVYLAPSQFEAMFVSAAHTADDIETTAGFAKTAFQAAAKILS